jgi:hypothetical protein
MMGLLIKQHDQAGRRASQRIHTCRDEKVSIAASSVNCLDTSAVERVGARASACVLLAYEEVTRGVTLLRICVAILPLQQHDASMLASS